jgi:tetratricopeptide (TPR) repeat protein
VTEEEYIAELRERSPRNAKMKVAPETIALADEATRAFPRSAKLWCMRGNLIQLSSENCPHNLDDALASYKRAIEIDSSFAEAWEEVGYFYHNVLDDEPAAQPYLHQAEKLKHPDVPGSARDNLRREFNAEEGSFLIQARVRLEWDWDAFRRLTSAMYDVADAVKGQPSIETWIAQGFWFCDTFIRDWTSHPNFPRPPEEAYRDALELLSNLASFLFTGGNPYKDDTTLRKKAKG